MKSSWNAQRCIRDKGCIDKLGRCFKANEVWNIEERCEVQQKGNIGKEQRLLSDVVRDQWNIGYPWLETYTDIWAREMSLRLFGCPQE